MFATCVVRDGDDLYQPGDAVPDSVNGFDELVEAGTLVEEYTPPERDPHAPDTSDLTPTAPDQAVTDGDAASAGDATS